MIKFSVGKKGKSLLLKTSESLKKSSFEFHEDEEKEEAQAGPEYLLNIHIHPSKSYGPIHDPPGY